MKSLIDIHVVLATPADMDNWDDNAEQAADRLNDLLFMLYQRADDAIAVHTLERMLQNIWEVWHQDPHLLDIDSGDLSDWVDHLLSSWDDEHFKQPE